MQATETRTEARARGYISRVLKDGYAFVKDEGGEECFLHIHEFRLARRTDGSVGKFIPGTLLEFTKEAGTPRPRAVKVVVLS